ncbi:MULTISPECIES: hypothetical protein [unclassified Bradyrhizobium]|uniref:hypothetical protein n=1 Tax=unclassified Bradyrhizobium TaxID=2631580 RepID=UPI00230524C8|nr:MULTISPECIES: hypothetical protein [unclassified Bradyrhizobium]MDA9405271.1 hypothetical protein [Bradyrhizobium sp. CCBAU 45384]MDA9440933.1 hypothetical protein [Bradyrhizobium sp. CCBAU 51745]
MMVGVRKDPSADQCGQLSLHLDLEPFPRAFRVDDDAVHKRPEVGDQRAAVVLCACVSRYRVGKRINCLDVAVQRCRMQRDGGRGLLEGSYFRLDAQPFLLQLGDPLLGILLGNHVVDHEINVALTLAFDPVTFGL